MAESERPSKLRKLSHDDIQEPVSQALGAAVHSERNDSAHDKSVSDARSRAMNGTGAHSLYGAAAEDSSDTPAEGFAQHDATNVKLQNPAHLHTQPEDHDNQHESSSTKYRVVDPSTSRIGDHDHILAGPDLPTGNDGDALPPPDEMAPLARAQDHDATAPKLSKSQQKKLQKRLDWDARADERKIFRKEKVVAKRERKRDAKRQERAEQGLTGDAPRLRRLPTPRSYQLPVTFMLDCDFDDLMRENERTSLGAQITRAYSDNRKSKYRAHVTVCSWGGQLRERFEKVLVQHKQWKGIRFLDGDFVEASKQAKEWMLDEKVSNSLAGSFSQLADLDADAQAKLKSEGEIVYLTSEAEETLTDLKPYSTYIIGGLVDHNREKGICYKRATRAGIRTARLPIGEFMDMTSRKVLATNHVNEIMLKWLESRDWGDAFLKVIPKRKGGKLKGTQDEAEKEAAEAEQNDEQDVQQGAESDSEEGREGDAAEGSQLPL